jgi:hypothetical protein
MLNDRKNTRGNKEMLRRFPLREFRPLRKFIRENWPGLHPATVFTWVKTGRYPYAIKQGRHWFIHPQQFEQWFADGKK